MASVERESVSDTVTACQNDHRCIGQADALVAVALDDGACLRDVHRRERLEPVHTAGNVFEQRKLGIDAHASGQEVIQLGKHEW